MPKYREFYMQKVILLYKLSEILPNLYSELHASFSPQAIPMFLSKLQPIISRYSFNNILRYCSLWIFILDEELIIENFGTMRICYDGEFSHYMSRVKDKDFSFWQLVFRHIKIKYLTAFNERDEAAISEIKNMHKEIYQYQYKLTNIKNNQEETKKFCDHAKVYGSSIGKHFAYDITGCGRKYYQVKPPIKNNKIVDLSQYAFISKDKYHSQEPKSVQELVDMRMLPQSKEIKKQLIKKFGPNFTVSKNLQLSITTVIEDRALIAFEAAQQEKKEIQEYNKLVEKKNKLHDIRRFRKMKALNDKRIYYQPESFERTKEEIERDKKTLEEHQKKETEIRLITDMMFDVTDQLKKKQKQLKSKALQKQDQTKSQYIIISQESAQQQTKQLNRQEKIEEIKLLDQLQHKLRKQMKHLKQQHHPLVFVYGKGLVPDTSEILKQRISNLNEIKKRNRLRQKARQLESEEEKRQNELCQQIAKEGLADRIIKKRYHPFVKQYNAQVERPQRLMKLAEEVQKLLQMYGILDPQQEWEQLDSGFDWITGSDTSQDFNSEEDIKSENMQEKPKEKIKKIKNEDIQSMYYYQSQKKESNQQDKQEKEQEKMQEIEKKSETSIGKRMQKNRKEYQQDLNIQQSSVSNHLLKPLQSLSKQKKKPVMKKDIVKQKIEGRNKKFKEDSDDSSSDEDSDD